MKSPLSALDRFRIIQPHLENNVSLSQLAKDHHKGKRTLQYWVKAYREKGIAGLERKNRSDKGMSISISLILRQVIEALALQKPPLPISTIHRKVVKIAQAQQWQVPTYRVVRFVTQQLNPGLKLLALEGSKTYAQAYELIYRRESSAPNEMWQADHTPLDILLIDENGQAAKPWLTTIIDDYSRIICGYYLSFDAPCTLHTALALRQAIWRKVEKGWMVCGIPQLFYTDNGSDFTSTHLEQVCIDLKIQTKFSIPGKPQGRGRIERFFLTTTQLLLSDLSGYAPAGAGKVKAVLTLEVFDRIFKNFILKDYNQRIHSATGMPPFKRWSDGGFLPQLPESLEQLDLLLMTVVKPRKVRRDGIHFQNFRYMDTTLAAYVGESVTIRYDPRDLAEIRVFFQDKFLCRAICQELAGEIVSLKEIIKARKRRKRELREIIQSRKTLLKQYLPDIEIPPEDSPLPIAVQKQEGTPVRKKLKLYIND